MLQEYAAKLEILRFKEVRELFGYNLNNSYSRQTMQELHDMFIEFF